MKQNQITEWKKLPKPDKANVRVPWMAVDCFCVKKQPCVCNMCDGYGWYFRNADTREIVSPMVVYAMERHV